jgi:8-oxo-dGTP pyrophosphatase MutT (NUDIX family)
MTNQSKPGDWQTLSNREVYNNPWIRVEEHRVINPSGGENQYGKVCFKNFAVAILALEDDTDTHIYLVGQQRYTLGRYSWELPMGGAPLGSSALAGAQRELKEETGLTATHWREVMQLDISNSVTDEFGIVFHARGLTPGETKFGATEDLRIRRLPFADALAMTLKGEITDAISVATILRYSHQVPRSPPCS